jgi:hypothetical protein
MYINYTEATGIHIDTCITWYKINGSNKEEVMFACMWKHHAIEVISKTLALDGHILTSKCFVPEKESVGPIGLKAGLSCSLYCVWLRGERFQHCQ